MAKCNHNHEPPPDDSEWVVTSMACQVCGELIGKPTPAKTLQERLEDFKAERSAERRDIGTGGEHG